MENHPIPQDVTGFKFKLIGSITVKQFLYLLGFGILATIAFVVPINPIARGTLMIFFASIGMALAFLPIDGRPMDTMIMNFAKTIPSENRYIYRKRGANLASYEVFKIIVKPKTAAAQAAIVRQSPNNDRRAMLLSRLRNSSFSADDGEAQHLKNIKSFFDETPGARTYTANPTITAAAKTNTAADLHKELDRPNFSPQKIQEVQTQLNSAIAEKEALVKKVIAYEVDKKPQKEVFRPSAGEEKQETKAAHYVAAGSTLQAGFPSLPDVGNVVMGIVRDPRGKTLPNILVEIMDQNNIPVRAFKTNALGQFASATPLANGTFKLSFEDPQKQHEFETIEITLDGSIFNPIETISVDSREKLRRELFGGITAQT